MVKMEASKGDGGDDDDDDDGGDAATDVSPTVAEVFLFAPTQQISDIPDAIHEEAIAKQW